MKVGTRELKNRLSYYLRRLQQGEESIFVTDRGEVVAEMKAVQAEHGEPSERDALVAMASRGELAMGTGKFKSFSPAKLKKRILFSQRVLDDRR